MNKNNLKSYAPKARLDFIAAITARAQQLGFTSTAVHDATLRGDILLINGVEWPAKVASQRAKLLEKILQHGFEQTIEEIAYTWFNRFAALRYMELHEFLDHGHRVLSSRDGGLPELLRHAGEVNLPGLQPAYVQELQLAGNQDNALYKLLLVAQCNELSRTMPFLFEYIDDETELLLPDNLLHTDSIVAKMVAGVPEEDWQEIEVIGWLYQFYISDKKDQVIGKVVKSEDIPAATQLFTPNWIVQYLVQNSVGRLWLMANPGSTLASQWPYYIQPAEQTPEVQAQLDALIQTRISEDGDTLNPETITVLDPACGSGHILVVAYDVLKAIYLERGYRLRDIPRLILEKNLYGLDIDDRAAQLAGFALLMKARADDRRLLADAESPPQLNILSLQESKGLSVDELCTHLNPFQIQRATIVALMGIFDNAKTFGSLIQIPYSLKTHLAILPQILTLAKQSGDMYSAAAANDLLPLVQQAQLLAMKFDTVLANPPYMGVKYYTPALKGFVSECYEIAKGDLYTCFILRNLLFSKNAGYIGMITIPNWMFLSSFEKLRKKLTKEVVIETLIHNGRGVFGSDFGSCSFVIGNYLCSSYKGRYRRLFEKQGSVSSNDELETKFREENDYIISGETFEKIPGTTFSYWASEAVVDLFDIGTPVSSLVSAQKGLAPCDSQRFVRNFWEISIDKIGIEVTSCASAIASGKKWFLFNKGGPFRKWYGNVEHVVNWEDDGAEIKRYISLQYPYLNGNTSFVTQNTENYFTESITWTYISSAKRAFRYSFGNEIPSNAAQSAFGSRDDLRLLLGFLNTPLAEYQLALMSPTLNSNLGEFLSVAVPSFSNKKRVLEIVDALIVMYFNDWGLYQASKNFSKPDFLMFNSKSISESYRIINLEYTELRLRAIELEFELNSILLPGPFAELIPSKDTLATDCVLRLIGPSDLGVEIIEYAVGCMLGRFSLDAPGLIYAHAGNVGFDASRYPSFPADADGILPVTDQPWFVDDAPTRIREFLHAVWGPDTLEENLAWLAESLGTKGSETPEETIRRYIADQFFKGHLQTYKKRPIYWLFSSGKQGAFQALVYLHRYHEGTLARMRSEYVIPLTAKYAARLELLTQDASAAPSTAARTKITKQIEKLRKQQAELLAFDEKLRHYADMRITLDLDDGVKVNYGKFGDLLDSVKIVTGGGSDD